MATIGDPALVLRHDGSRPNLASTERAETAYPICAAAGPSRSESGFLRALHALDGGTPVGRLPCVSGWRQRVLAPVRPARLRWRLWLEFMIQPLIVVNRLRPVRSFVDAGCGLGYTVDLGDECRPMKPVGHHRFLPVPGGGKAFSGAAVDFADNRFVTKDARHRPARSGALYRRTVF
jgi:hypothetical protein